MVNRVWMHHFGKPLVGTPSDFGARSDAPTHPELLDYLAARTDVRLIGPRDAAQRAPTVAVDLGRAAEPVSVELGKRGIACWAGDFYAVRPLTAMGVDLEKGVLRMSAVHYTGAEDVARLIAALDEVL